MLAQPLTAGELCTRSTVIAYRNTGLNEAARLMREQHVGNLVVVEETVAGRLTVGVLTDRDIVTAVVARDMNPSALTVGDVMSTNPITVREGDSVLDVLAVMRHKGVRRLPVTDSKGVLLGVITLDDLLGVVSEQLRGLVEAIESEQQREQRARP
jgi:signal-transduction protein with cAMP-binding, CBS, and nucleotidyltransferase domain